MNAIMKGTGGLEAQQHSCGTHQELEAQQQEAYKTAQQQEPWDILV